jgi:tetratricopeptide (TPR) repeat protein
MTGRINLLKSFISEDPSDPFNYYALAMELKNQDQNESLNILNQLIHDFPEYLPSYYQLGSSLIANGQHEAATSVLKKGISLAITQKDHKALAELRQLLSSLEDE